MNPFSSEQLPPQLLVDGPFDGETLDRGLGLGFCEAPPSPVGGPASGKNNTEPHAFERYHMRGTA